MRQVVNANKPFGLGSLNVGYEGENNVTEVAFDFTEWVEQYGNGSPVLRVKRFRDTAAYPVVLDIESGNIAVWTITNTDLQYHGIGQGQLQYVVGDTVKKSVVFDFMVEKSLESSEDAPDPYDDWMDDLIRLTGESETNAYNAGVSATNAATSELNAATSETNAGISETNAQGYANDASGSANDASGYANEAKGYRNQASGYADDANGYKSDASGYANDASGYASDAQGYANDASGYASDAQGYASDASDSADSASASAEEAREYAEDSKTYAVPSNVRGAILALFESAAYAVTGLEDEIAIVESWAEEVQSLILSDTELELEEDTPQAITAVTIPYGATVLWETSNPLVATVVDGIVTGASNGSCTITATAGDKTATCDVSVSGFSELVSISAVYTQSGTVYETDSLDSLKADLVVTATYSDSSTEVVTLYTLSGTLEVGTSTITVVYGGKITTFNVTVSLQSNSWSYDPSTDGLLSTQAYIIGANVPSTCTESVVDGKLHLYVPKNSSVYISYPFAATSATSATLKFKIKFNDISQVNAWGYGFMPCISNGEGGAVLAQRNVGNSTLTWVTFVGNTYENTNVSYEKNTWYEVELTLANGKQSAKVNGTYIYQNKDLSTRSEHLANNIVARTNTNTQYTFNADIEYIQYIEE